MIYVDPLLSCVPSKRWKWGEACHLFADNEEELHAFAARLGMKRSWFQNHPRLKHYDLTAGRRRQAVALGAIEVTREQIVAFMRSGGRWERGITDVGALDVGGCDALGQSGTLPHIGDLPFTLR